MEIIAILVVLFLLVTNSGRFKSLREENGWIKDDITDLKNRLTFLEGHVKGGAIPEPEAETGEDPAQKLWAVDSETEAVQDTEVFESEPDAEPVREPVSPRVKKEDWLKEKRSNFEQNIATKLPVWLGAISLIFAAFFLMKYSTTRSQRLAA